MQLDNTRLVPASPDEVFAALNDPAVLKACVPGCESLDRSGENTFNAAMTARVGPVSAKFNGRMTLADIDPGRGYSLRFEGQGGAAGFANGEARVMLAPAEGGQTSLHYIVTAQVGGKLAQIGSRLVDGAAAKLADDFFARFGAHFAATNDRIPADADGQRADGMIASQSPGATPASPGKAPAGGPPPDTRAPSEAGTWTRFLAIAAIVVILAYLYFRGGHFR